MQPVILVCGVPGSGKTWVCKQVQDRFTYVPHDEYKTTDYTNALVAAAKTSNKPVLGEAPFRVSIIESELSDEGINVESYMIFESPETVTQRYEAREGHAILKQHLTNLARYKAQRRYWNGTGTSEQILEQLKARE